MRTTQFAASEITSFAGRQLSLLGDGPGTHLCRSKNNTFNGKRWF